MLLLFLNLLNDRALKIEKCLCVMFEIPELICIFCLGSFFLLSNILRLNNIVTYTNCHELFLKTPIEMFRFFDRKLIEAVLLIFLVVLVLT